MKQRILFMIKTDGMLKEKMIMAKINPLAKVIATHHYLKAPMEKIAELYKPHQNKKFYPWFFKHFQDAPIKVMILEGKELEKYKDNFINEIVRIVGATDPKKAKEGTIRAMSNDDMALSFKQGRIVKNLVHRSDNPEDGLREGAIFFADYVYDNSKLIQFGEMARELVDPLSLNNAIRPSVSVSGIFFEERLEDCLRKMNIIMLDEDFISYEETPPGWQRGGAETFIAVAKLKVKPKNGKPIERKFIAKSFLQTTNDTVQKLNESIERRRVLVQADVSVPHLYFCQPTTVYEQFIEYPAQQILETATGKKKAQLLKEINDMMEVVKTKFPSAKVELQDIRSDGDKLYWTDFGEDLGKL